MELARILIAIPLVIATATPAIAQTTATAQASSSETGERRVCRSRQRTGSNIRVRRVCLTESQWRARDRLDQERVDDLNNRMNGACRPALEGSGCIGD
ncbi:MAG: hypothetical protein ACK4SZ_10250 [Allosphingosinicella sp.]|uniref:hypothetical protein n=1 Tax=Allosphingosinicella sp. TaxID=2823234 RepID=UPI003921C8C3